MMLFKDRNLSLIERGVLLWDLKRQFVFSTIVHVKGGLDEKILGTALRILQKKHYYLNVTVDLKPVPRYIYHDDISIPIRVIEETSDELWIKETQRENMRPFDIEKELFLRAVLIKGDVTDLILCFNHSISDGISAMEFTHELMELCGKIGDNQEIPDVVPLDPIYPSIDYFPLSNQGLMGSLKKLGFIISELFSMVRFPKKHFPAIKYIPFEERKTYFKHRKFSAEDTKKLIAHCRRKNTTIQGALCAAFFIAVGEAIKEHENIEIPAVLSITDLNLRPQCRYPVLNEQFGVWVGQSRCMRKLKQDVSFWKIARDTIKALKKAVKSNMTFTMYSILFPFLDKNEDKFIELTESTIPIAEVSNLGRLNYKVKQGPFTIENVHFAISIATNMTTRWGMSIAASTFNEQMTINVHHLSILDEGGIAEKITNRCIELLRYHSIDQ